MTLHNFTFWRLEIKVYVKGINLRSPVSGLRSGLQPK
jgi:hypothetical protein